MCIFHLEEIGVGVWKHIRNILVVWMLTGIWHGASWNFVLWGLYYGILLLIEKFVLGKYLKKLPGVFQHIYCMFFVMLGWNLFVFDDMSAGISFARALFGTYGAGFCSRETLYLLYNNAVLMVLLILGSTQLPARAGNWICAKLRGKETILTIVKNVFYVGIFLLSVAWLVDASYNPFLDLRSDADKHSSRFRCAEHFLICAEKKIRLTKIMYSRSLSCICFCDRFFASCTRISLTYTPCTPQKFGHN